jgi:hypothetical protein
MPQLKPKPSEIAAEAKRTYLPYIEQKFTNLPTRSFLHQDTDNLRVRSSKDNPPRKLRVAVIDGDPVDVALDWYEYEAKTRSQNGLVQETMRIPVVNMANEKRAGGDWESGLMAPEENLCRRSNLVPCLNTPWQHGKGQNFPIPTKGGIYSPYVGEYHLKRQISPSERLILTCSCVSIRP